MTFADEFYLTTRNPMRRLLRNLRLLRYIAQLIWYWLVLGGRVRKAVAQARATGVPYDIDHLADRQIMSKE